MASEGRRRATGDVVKRSLETQHTDPLDTHTDFGPNSRMEFENGDPKIFGQP